jgi:hypothetical protein
VTYAGLPAGALLVALLGNHSIRVRVEVLTLEMKPVSTLSNRVLDGQVNIDATAEVTRSATLTLLDRDHSLHFDSNSPADGALYADRMLRVWYDVRSPGGSWIEVPLITGPVSRFTRDGSKVNVEIQGKESLARGVAWRTKTYRKGATKVDVIEDVMRKEGERHFSLARATAKLPGDKSLTVDTIPWEFVKALAASMGLQLFYDGFGRLVLRRPPGTSLWTFASGDGGSILTAPRVTFSIDAVKNAVRVVGTKPKGAKAKVRATAVAPRNHPLSPFRLGRNGEGRYLAEFIDDTSIGSDAEAGRVARGRLDALLMQAVDVEFDSLVIPHLDAGDVVTVKTDDFTMQTRLDRFTIPLLAAGTMPVGYNRRVTPRKRTAKKGHR